MGRGESGFDWKESIRESELEVAYQPKNGPVLARTDLCPPQLTRRWARRVDDPGGVRGRGAASPSPAALRSAATRGELVKGWCGGARARNERASECGTVWESGRQLAAP
jgi:hypothetical protein